MENKNSFVLYKDSFDSLEGFNFTELGKLFTLIYSYQRKPDSPVSFSISPKIQTAFNFFKAQFKRDDFKYQEKSKIRSEIGKRGGVASAKKRWGKSVANNLSKSKQNNQMVTKVSKVTDSDSDSVSDSDNIYKETISSFVNNSEKTSKKSLIKLTQSEKIEIALEHHVDISVISPIERAVLNPENIRKYKYKTTFYTIKKWLDRQIADGKTKTLDENGMMVLKTLYGGSND